MAVTTGHFANQYTFAIVDNPGGYAAQLPLIQSNAIAAINYLSDFLSWKGTLDFVVRFGSPTMFGAGGLGLLPAYGGIAAGGNTFAASEAFTGVDANGGDGDVGLWLLPNANGSLTNYGVSLSFDATPDGHEIYSPPAGTHDFFSIFLHEVVHGMGFWSVAQHGAAFGQSRFDTLTQQNGAVWEFTGSNVQALLGQNLRLAQTGSRDHYGGVAQNLAAFPFVDRGLMFEFGNYEANRWHLGQLDLAVLRDLGWTTANQTRLSVVELPDGSPNLSGNASANGIFGDHQNNTLNGQAGNDALYGNLGNDVLNGGSENDTLIGGQGADTLTGGTASDVFQFALGDLQAGNVDRISDYTPGTDAIRILSNVGGDAVAMAAGHAIVTFGNTAQIELTGKAGQVIRLDFDNRLEYWDTGTNAPWSRYTDYLNAQGQISDQEIINDNGTLTQRHVDLSPGGTLHAWIEYTDYYSAAPHRLTDQEIRFDNGSIGQRHLNQAGTLEYTDYVTPGAVLLDQEVINLNGTREQRHYDPAGTRSAQWSSYTDFFNAANPAQITAKSMIYDPSAFTHGTFGAVHQTQWEYAVAGNTSHGVARYYNAGDVLLGQELF